jgi:hypothetical protein
MSVIITTGEGGCVFCSISCMGKKGKAAVFFVHTVFCDRMSKALAICTIIVIVAHCRKSAKYSLTSSAHLQERN